MGYLLDTNACIAYLNQVNQVFIAKLRSHSPDEIVLCDIVKLELYYGAYNSRRSAENLETLRYFFDEFQSLPFDGDAAQVCGYWRRELKQRGQPIGAYDLQIAASPQQKPNPHHPQYP
ncbi:MAG: type II toxin-antitoxin system VapC family toxin [Cyanobacteria bacterium P01_C01_bin.89]